MQASGKLVLIDGYAHIYRNYYAIRNLTTPGGQAVNALFGMARFALLLDQNVPHGFGAMAMDAGKPAKRLAILPEYKANRAAMPDELRQQIPLVKEWMQAMGWAILREEGREADDLIGAVVRVREGHETVVASQDKDLAQLVCDDVSLLNTGVKGQWLTIGPAEVQAKFGVPPAAIRDYLALLGDSSDNIPGIKGIGAKTAAALLQQFGSIENMMNHLDEIAKPAVRNKLEGVDEQLQRNCELVGLDYALPSDWKGVDSLRRRQPDWERLLAMANEYGFKSLLPALRKAREAFENPSLF
jgi:DNA polymerase-1